MENVMNSDQESEKTAEINTAVPPTERMDAAEPSKNDPNPDLLKKLQDELSEAKEKYLRLYAEFDNHRRRSAKEKLDLISSANEQLIKSLLPISDDFERAEKAFRDKNDKESEGFFHIQNKFRKTLEQCGVKPMEISDASEFNADLHEAITQIPVPDEQKKGKIIDVVEKGFLLNDKVIRFAKVVIGG